MKRTRDLLAANRCTALLVGLITLLVLGPPLAGTDLEWMGVLLQSVIMFAGLVALTFNRTSTIVGIVIGAPHFISLLLASFFDLKTLGVIDMASALVFHAYLAGAVLTHAARGDHVTMDTIFGAVCAYLLIGLSWCYLYALVEMFNPGSFQGLDNLNVINMLYFSYTTLTTLGYGDITPVAGLAKSLAALEAVTGLMFVSVLVARLVAMYRPKAERG